MTMLLDAPSLYPEPVERRTPPGRGYHGYYRRERDGWIMTGGAWPTFKNDMEFKDLEFLANMPTFLMSFGDNEEESNMIDLRGRRFFPHKEPWRLIFQAPGGAALFPVEQIIAYRWHLRPPYREVAFPQLDGLTIYDQFCPECDIGIFSSANEAEAAEMLRIHLTCRTNDAHSYRPEDLRALGEEIGVDFFAPRRGRRSATRMPREETPKAVVPPAPDLTPNEVATKECPECHEMIKVSGFVYARHLKAHKKEPVNAGA